MPRTLSVSPDDDGTLSLETFLRSTDGNNPCTISTGQSINADQYNARWALGPVSFNGTAIDEVVSVSIDFGIEVRAVRLTGNFPQRLYIVRRRPSVTIVFTDFAEAQLFAAAHTVMTALVVYLRKRSGATFVSDVTAEHVRVSFGDGMAQLDTLGASAGENGTGSVTLFGEAITVAAASAIT